MKATETVNLKDFPSSLITSLISEIQIRGGGAGLGGMPSQNPAGLRPLCPGYTLAYVIGPLIIFFLLLYSYSTSANKGSTPRLLFEKYTFFGLLKESRGGQRLEDMSPMKSNFLDALPNLAYNKHILQIY